jgi:hypothetical protein
MVDLFVVTISKVSSGVKIEPEIVARQRHWQKYIMRLLSVDGDAGDRLLVIIYRPLCSFAFASAGPITFSVSAASSRS